MEIVRRALKTLMYADHSIVNPEDNDDDSDVESQDEEDMGYGARLGGGFTSVVRVQFLENTNIELCVDNLKGYCTSRPIGSPEEAVSS
jgi:hypothetical protein